ncbi:MAG: hypothetical protein AAF363_11465 [Bacteroidota bacterium]
MKKKIIYSLLVVLVSLVGCEIGDNSSADPSESFLRIFDTNEFEADFTPLDLAETPDGGFLVLSGIRRDDSNFLGVHVLKTDEFGTFVSETVLDPSFVNPVDQLVEINGLYYFFCMNEFQEARLFSMDTSGIVQDPIAVNAVTYPSYLTASDQNLLLLSYDNDDKRTILSEISTDGSLLRSQGFGIGAGVGVEEPIIDHFTRTGRQLPFFAGVMENGTFFFNGFVNFTISMIFTRLDGAEPSGILQGQQDDGAMSRAIPISGGRFAASRFNFGDNYYIPSVNIEANGITSSTDLAGNPILELESDAPVVIEEVEVEGVRSLIFGSNTKDGQILISAYSEETGELNGIQFIGFSSPYELADITTTEDGGIAVLSRVFIAGRFPRIAVNKISVDELRVLVQ